MKDIAIFGAGGFGREVAALIKQINKSEKEPCWNFIGFFDDNAELKGTRNEYGEVLGGKAELNEWKSPIDIAIAIGTPQVVKSIAEGITNPLVEYPNIIAPNTEFLDINNVKMGKGNILYVRCFVSTNVTIGDFNVLNATVMIGHDATIGNYNVFMPCVNISGGVKIGDTNFMGLKSSILQYLKMGNEVRVGAGAIIMRNTKDGLLYVGVPAKKVEL